LDEAFLNSLKVKNTSNDNNILLFNDRETPKRITF